MSSYVTLQMLHPIEYIKSSPIMAVNLLIIIINMHLRIYFQRVFNENNSEYQKTNGQIERMNRALKETTVNNFYYSSHGSAQTVSAC
ncbi:hypothetical protein P618_200049 [Holospora obtusa F1]|uniref:Uncharacterized protein n=1 Tax=Holospora obtusa F1 TaxID=1399147 RepID=W6TEK7_HOLOB|nr:hypothetical protein P618_200049 [Holospora obtusa F1]